jgi:hypothetical protein
MTTAANTSNLDRELQKLSEKDRKQIQQAQEMLGPDPDSMGLVKNYFWGRFRKDLLLPHPEPSAEETARFRDYLRSKWLPSGDEKTQWMTLGRAAEEITNIQEQNGADDAVIDAIREFFADRRRVLD